MLRDGKMGLERLRHPFLLSVGIRADELAVIQLLHGMLVAYPKMCLTFSVSKHYCFQPSVVCYASSLHMLLLAPVEHTLGAKSLKVI